MRQATNGFPLTKRANGRVLVAHSSAGGIKSLNCRTLVTLPALPPLVRFQDCEKRTLQGKAGLWNSCDTTVRPKNWWHRYFHVLTKRMHGDHVHFVNVP